jgi:acetyl-CoA/propionyl-CoA carboxylase biotin carboxyl carrier protein
MRRALDDFAIAGVPTTIRFHQRVLASDQFRAGETSTSFLTDFPEVIPPAANVEERRNDDEPTPIPLNLVVEVDGRRFETTIRGLAPVANGKPMSNRRGNRRNVSPTASASSQDDLVSPIHGTVIRLEAGDGDKVKAGQVIAVVEAMKMENELTAHKPGTVRDLALSVGGTVSIGQRIATIGDDAGA